MKVLGIDTSLTSTGLAIAHEGRIVSTCTIKSVSTGTSLTEWERRIKDVVNRVRGVIDREEPYLAVIESPAFASKFGNPHERSGVWWGVVHALANRGVLLARVSPKQRAKYATGDGNAKKPAVHAAVKRDYGRPDLPIKSNDEGDAVLLAAMGARHLHQAVDLFTVGPEQLKAMEKIEWP